MSSNKKTRAQPSSGVREGSMPQLVDQITADTANLSPNDMQQLTLKTETRLMSGWPVGKGARLIDHAVAIQYEEGGMEGALSYLLKTLGAGMPVERILYSGNRTGIEKNEELAYAGGISNESHASTFKAISPRSMSPFRLQNGAEAFLVDNAEQGGSKRVLMREHHAHYKTMLAVPLFAEKGHTYHVAVMSEKVDAYTHADAELIYAVSRSLSERLQQAYAHSEVMDDEEVEMPYPGNSSLMLLRRCKCLSEVVLHAEKVGRTDSTVLITGETGTGKEVLADVIHELSSRVKAPLVKVNCGGIPETLIESEFFGYEKGAFTGAIASHSGYFEQANGGTLFLDEVGDLSLQAQVRLLRVLERREIQRLGGAKRKPVDVRVIAATHRDLADMVIRGTFREDLWFRLNVFPIHIPPLRWRQEDLPALLRHFIERSARAMHIIHPPTPRPDEIARLVNYAWPGNLRELSHVVERAMILAMNDDGGCGQLHFSLPKAQDLSLKKRYGHLSSKALPTMDALTESYLRFVLEKTEGRIGGPEGAAAILSMPPNTLRSRLRQLGLYSPGKRGRPRVMEEKKRGE